MSFTKWPFVCLLLVSHIIWFVTKHRCQQCENLSFHRCHTTNKCPHLDFLNEVDVGCYQTLNSA